MDRPVLDLRNALQQYASVIRSWTPSGDRTDIRVTVTDLDGWTASPVTVPALGLPDLISAVHQTRLLYNARAQEAAAIPGVIDLAQIRKQRRA
jgi:hypothetical protein